jgi:hypothetical protein
MLLVLALLLLITSTAGLSLRTQHDFWFLNESPKAVGNDLKWGYCDLKCLYLEHYNPGKDFVVIVMEKTFHDTFAACYVKTADGYTLWNKVDANPYYEEQCGGDSKDWVNLNEFSIKRVYGEGIGTEIPEDATYADM